MHGFTTGCASTSVGVVVRDEDGVRSVGDLRDKRFERERDGDDVRVVDRRRDD